MRDPRYDVLFEPVQIGPVTARNRFFQVPHCNGMGHRHPSAHAEMRGVKAEGGWAVVCTEEVEIHHSTDVARFVEGRLWDDADIPMHERLVDEGARARVAGRDRARPQRDDGRQPLRPRAADGAGAPAGADHRSGAGAADEQARHRRPAPLAPGRRSSARCGPATTSSTCTPPTG